MLLAGIFRLMQSEVVSSFLLLFLARLRCAVVAMELSIRPRAKCPSHRSMTSVCNLLSVPVAKLLIPPIHASGASEGGPENLSQVVFSIPFSFCATPGEVRTHIKCRSPHFFPTPPRALHVPPQQLQYRRQDALPTFCELMFV